MERVLSPDEKLKRAEQIYYKRKGLDVRERKKIVNVPMSNKKYILRKMMIQIVVCLLIYCTYFAIKNYNFFFSENVIDKTNQVLSYDLNIQDIYCKIANYIQNYDYFNKNNQEPENQELTQENIDEDNNIKDENEEETKLETEDNSEFVEEIIEEAKIDETTLSQMELDANDIKCNYDLISPLNGQVTSRFGPREVTQEKVSPYHVGLDIAANNGTIFVAGMDGKVVYSGELGGYGKCIQTQIDDVLVIYGHCSKLYANTGDMVMKGDKIGEVGQTGNATGPHLHFEIRKSGRYVNPELILST